MDTRLYIELIPSDETRDRLGELTDALKNTIKGRPVEPSKWHVTVLHFGVAEHVFHDIRRVMPNLTNSVFQENLTLYIETAKQHLPSPTSLTPTELSLFGINRSVLALRLLPNDDLIKSHDQALLDLTTFLKGCGVDDPEEFMKSSINFKWALELSPHITLFRGLRDNPDLSGITIDSNAMDFSSADIHGIRN